MGINICLIRVLPIVKDLSKLNYDSFNRLISNNLDKIKCFSSANYSKDKLPYLIRENCKEYTYEVPYLIESELEKVLNSMGFFMDDVLNKKIQVNSIDIYLFGGKIINFDFAKYPKIVKYVKTTFYVIGFELKIRQIGTCINANPKYSKIPEFIEGYNEIRNLVLNNVLLTSFLEVFEKDCLVHSFY